MGGAIPIVLFSLVISCVLSLDRKSFPDNFMFGVASSAYQIEGASKEDGKGQSIWDHHMHNDSQDIQNDTEPGSATDSYHKYKEDVELIASMNLNHYKFSLSWTRILPTGFKDSINAAGIDYYRNLISELQKKGITPMVTLYHWDLPQSIQDRGGWTNTETIQYFVDYARVAFQSFSGVGYWITIHEPKQVCRGGYGNGSLAPFFWDTGISDYKCAYVILKAHAAVYHMYKNEFPHLKGKISIALDGSWSEPVTNSLPDSKAAKRRNEFEFGLYANPIFVKGWPQMAKQIVENRSQPPYFNSSRLPAFTGDEISEIKGTADFMALNYYGARGVGHRKVDLYPYGYDSDLAVTYWKNESWIEMANGLSIVPWSIQSFTRYIKDTYGQPEIIVTGNGVADEDLIHDKLRMDYIADHLKYILKAIKEDKVTITGYTYCNLLDSFEWDEGYRSHYGLFGVDMTNKTRYPKDAVGFYRRIAKKSDVFPTSTNFPRTSNSSELTSASTASYTDTTATSQRTTSSDTPISTKSDSSTTTTSLPKTSSSSKLTSTSTAFQTDTANTVQSSAGESCSSEMTRSSDWSTSSVSVSAPTITPTSSISPTTTNSVTSTHPTAPSTHSGSPNLFGTSVQLLVGMIIFLQMSSQHYGLYSVDLTSSNKDRKAKDAVAFYGRIAKDSEVPDVLPTPNGITNSPVISTTARYSGSQGLPSMSAQLMIATFLLSILLGMVWS